MKRSNKTLKGFLTMACGGFLLFFAVSAVIAFFGNAHFTRPPVKQPVVFNHRLHVEDEELECSACHAEYETGVHSGMPEAEVCSLCHSEAQGDSPEEEKLVGMLEAGLPLNWKSLSILPPNVFFSHRRHVPVAGIPCSKCHGEMGKSLAPPANPHPLTMNECIQCHRLQKVSTSCSACHR